MKLPNIIMSDGDEFFANLKNNYITHSKGLFIVTPSGAGKTYFCDRQTEPHWIDGDVLWIYSGAQPTTEW